MSDRRRIWPWLLLIGGITAGVIFGRTLFLPEPPPPVYLPGETVPVEVRSQDDINRLAVQSDLIDGLHVENGQLTDSLGRAVKALENVNIETEGEEAPPEVEAIICPTLPDVPKPKFRATANLFKFEGLDPHGNLSYGWAGTISCQVTAGTGPPSWADLVREPLDLRNTIAASTEAPEPPQRGARWYAGFHYSVLQDSTDYNYYNPARFRVYTGRRWFPKKRFSIRTGVWADSRSAGVDLGLDF